MDSIHSNSLKGNDSRNANTNIVKINDLKALLIHLKKMNSGDVVFYKNAEIEKGKYFEVKKSNHYHEGFKDAKELIGFLENEKAWFEKKRFSKN